MFLIHHVGGEGEVVFIRLHEDTGFASIASEGLWERHFYTGMWDGDVGWGDWLDYGLYNWLLLLLSEGCCYRCCYLLLQILLVEVVLHLLDLVEPCGDYSGTPEASGSVVDIGCPYLGHLFDDHIWVKKMDVKGGLRLPSINIIMELLPLIVGDKVGRALLE